MKMKLKKLIVENFMMYASATFDFFDITKIMGKNGKGKSSIVNAYTWLMFNCSYDLSDNPAIRRKVNGKTVDDMDVSVTAVFDVDGKEVTLTPKEFDLLVFLANNRGLALSREKILQKVWNYDYFGEDRTVDTHVKMLRGHLGKCRGYIATVWGIGYKFDPDAAH